MPDEKDAGWRAAEGWREQAELFGGLIRTEWQEFRKQVNTSIGILSSELVRLQRYIDKQTDEAVADKADRVVRQRRNDRFQWGIVIAIAALWVVNLLVLAYIAGGR